MTFQKLDEINLLSSYEELEPEYCKCSDPMHYAPDLEYPIFEDEKVIRVNFHFMNSMDKTQNHRGEDAVTYAQNLINDANSRYRKNAKMRLPLGNDTPVYDTKIVLKLVKDESTPSGLAVYEHVDEELYFIITKGRHKNNYNRKVIKKYAIHEDTVLNVFAMPHHPDSMAREGYKGSISGIALGNSIKIAGVNKHAPHEAWKETTLFMHEIGHVFGLRHAWTRNDMCEDTPVHTNCWDQYGPPPCDSLLSNNMMDYNNAQNAITPCQIGVMRSKMYSSSRKSRGLVEVDFCDYDPEKSLIVKDSFHMNRAFDMKGSIIVKEGGYLKLSCRLHMPIGSKIIIEPGGTLDINKASLHNACGDMWGGIELNDNGKKKAHLIIRKGSSILDTREDNRSTEEQ